MSRAVRSSRGAAGPRGCPLRLEMLEPRYLFSAGQLDTTFNGTGYASIPPLSQPFAASAGLAVQPDGKMLVVSEESNGLFTGLVLVRFDTDGSWDQSFGTGGEVVTTSSGIHTAPGTPSVIVLPDSKIVALIPNSANAAFTLVGYNSDGSLDTSFGNGRVDIVDFPPNSTAGLFLPVLSETADGHILVAGASDSNWAVAEMNDDGTFNTSFGDRGVAYGLSDPTAGSFELNQVIAQANGDIALAGKIGGFPWTIGRYTSTGAIDTSFGSDGFVHSNVDGTGTGGAVAFGLAQQPDGNLVVDGWGSSYDAESYNADGSVDSLFNGGQPLIPTWASGTSGNAYAVSVQQNGKILLGGQLEVASGPNGNVGNFGVLRLNADGSVDTTFGSAGLAQTDFNTQATGLNYRAGVAMALTPSGDIVVVSKNDNSWIVARFTGDPTHPWQNPTNPYDVNGDGTVAPLDALIVLNYLNANGPGALTGSPTGTKTYYDVNGDGSIAPLDALEILNFLNANISPQAARVLAGPAGAPSARTVDLSMVDFGLADVSADESSGGRQQLSNKADNRRAS
jgi:uncharacterized delta-60 repeat protein